MTFGSIAFDPYLPWGVILTLAGIALALLVLAAVLRLNGWFLRFFALGLLVAGLANPAYRQEDRNPLSDIVIVVVDESASQTLSDRESQTASALQELLDRLPASDDQALETRIVTVRDTSESAQVRGTLLLQALSDATAEVSSDRLAGAVIISDGRNHDLTSITDFPAPVHLLQTGHPEDWDRRMVIENGPAFGIVDEDVTIAIRIEDTGAVPEGMTTAIVEAAIDGGEVQEFTLPVGETVELALNVEHAGINLLEFYTRPIDGEITDRNNRAILSINGVRDRLSVLLVSGEPYPGERTWRNLLKSDASVDLVHFTILRSPDKQDGVPVNELSLIAFPTRELFMDKIEDFDLIIFDRYRRRGVLPDVYLDNVAKYVREGGAILINSGPAFAEVESLARSSLRSVLPAMPTGRVFEEGYYPSITDLGEKHPVTRGLDTVGGGGEIREGDDHPWGRWFRQIDMFTNSGFVLMEGVEDKPLLVLDRVDEGRIAILASDHAWLWTRGVEGGGPQLELLRRLAHWLMQEPELEEEVLNALAKGESVTVERRSLEDVPPVIDFISPSGVTGTADLTQVQPGQWTAEFMAEENGIYRVTNGDTDTVVAVGPASPKEYEAPIGMTPELVSFIDETGGGIFALSEDGVPRIRRTRPERVAAGSNWMGLTLREAYTVQDIRIIPLAPGWLILLLVAMFSFLAWRVEGR